MKNQINVLEVDRMVEKFGESPEAIFSFLHEMQKVYGYLPKAALNRVCELTQISPTQLEEVSSFYAPFRRTPVGKHLIQICTSAVAHAKGADKIYNAVLRALDIPAGEETDANDLFTVIKVPKLGYPTLAPAMQIDDIIYGKVHPEKVPALLQDFLRHDAHRHIEKKHALMDKGFREGKIRVGLGSCCIASGSQNVLDALTAEISKLQMNIEIRPVSCTGMCSLSPLLEVAVSGRNPVFYSNVNPDDIPLILARHFQPKKRTVKMRIAVDRKLEALYTQGIEDPSEERIINLRDPAIAAFLDPQKQLSTEHRGITNPTDLKAYQKRDGFQALEKIVTQSTPEKWRTEIKKSALCEAHELIAAKWTRFNAAEGDIKTIICNGNDGDPSSFAGRMMLESYPHRIIEGMLLTAFATGATQGMIYLRGSDTLANERLQKAINDCTMAGWLGENILEKNVSFTLKVFQGEHAFVCNEESALIAAIEGKRATPRYCPPHPTEQGLHGQPTLIHTPETFSLIPWIARNGGTAFSKIGTPQTAGTLLVSLTGKIKNTGLIEVPTGTSIQDIVEKMGGGILKDRPFKAVQIGGPSGACIPASACNIPFHVESLSKQGVPLGSAGIVVFDSHDCMLEMARHYMEFFQKESCGKCTPCRVGTQRMLEILTRLCEGNGTKADLEQLETLGKILQQNSLCALGKTAPNPVLTALRSFRSEFEAHLKGSCPAGQCKKLITYTINDLCNGCTICAVQCPVSAIEGEAYKTFTINQDLCIHCGNCRKVCPIHAVDAHKESS